MRAVFTNQQVIERYLPLIDEGTAAFLDRAVAAADTPLDVLIREAAQPAKVVPLPFFKRRAPQT